MGFLPIVIGHSVPTRSTAGSNSDSFYFWFVVSVKCQEVSTSETTVLSQKREGCPFQVRDK